MNPAVEKFGRIVDEQLTRPGVARGLLTTAYRLNGWAGKHVFKKTTPARLQLADVCNQMVLRPFNHPKQCAMVSLFTPCELLQAFDLAPLEPEVLACYLSGAGAERGFVEAAEKAGVPETLCSYHKILLGAAETGVLPRPRFIYNTTLACDANLLSFRRLAKFYDVPHFVLDIPFTPDEAAVDYVAEQMKEIAQHIAKLMNRPLDKARLCAAMKRGQETLAAYHDYLLERPKHSMPDEMSSEMFALIGLHVLLGTQDSLDFAKGVLAEAKAAPPRGNELRLLWVHTLPNVDTAMVNLLDFSSKCQVLASDLCFDTPDLSAETDPWRFMARRLVMDSMNGPAQRRVDAVLEQARRMQPDGIVWFCHWGCRQTDGASQMARTQLEAAGFPTLVLDGDSCDRSNCPPGQMMTRMQAFLEILEGQHDRVHM